ncbi:AAA family ATPase [Ferrovum sp.]|uniref:AAA family ATPase n=1 Tax=Ferrovum sp. TaxID=2609467 RepID=UPI003456D528
MVVLRGPRQAGKTTLVWQFAFDRRKFVPPDDELTLLSAHQDPVGLIRGLDCAVIDEVQRTPVLHGCRLANQWRTYCSLTNK